MICYAQIHPNGHAYASTASVIAHLPTVPLPPIESTANKFTMGLSFLLRARRTSRARRPPRIANVGGKKWAACEVRCLRESVRVSFVQVEGEVMATYSIILDSMEGTAFSLIPKPLRNPSAISVISSFSPPFPVGNALCRDWNSHKAECMNKSEGSDQCDRCRRQETPYQVYREPHLVPALSSPASSTLDMDFLLLLFLMTRDPSGTRQGL